MLSRAVADGTELRALEVWHAAEFFAHIERVREHIAPWIPMAEMTTDVESARGVIARYARNAAEDGPRLYGLWVDGELNGTALFRIFDVASAVCEVGVWISPEFQGRGIVSAAVTCMIDWAVDVRGMQRVEWLCDPRNARSQAVAKRLGFTHEGTLRSVFEMYGKRYDSQVWAVLADEWRAARSCQPEVG